MEVWPRRSRALRTTRSPPSYDLLTAGCHYPVATIEALAAQAGLEIVDRRGQSPGVVLHPEIDEQRHCKALFLARKGGIP